MDSAAYAIQKMHPSADLDIAWMCDNDHRNKEFLVKNYPRVFRQGRFYDDVTRRPLLQKWHRQIDIYVAGPPCQDFSSAGRKHMWSGTRSNLYMHAVEAIINIQPKIAFLENSCNMYNASKGIPIQKIVDKISRSGYIVEQNIINTLHYGLPQNRNRLYLICIRQDCLVYPYQSPKHIPPISTDKLLIPIGQEVTDWKNLLGPGSIHSRLQVLKAQRNLNKELLEQDTFLAEHCSKNFQPNPEPSKHMPAITSSKRTGHWIVNRGRPITLAEAARFHGFLYNHYKWHQQFGHPREKEKMVKLLKDADG